MTIDPASSTAVRLAAAGVAYAPEIAAAARRHGIDPSLLAAVAAQETGGPGANAGRNVVGDGGHGHGLFQIDDRSHAFAESQQASDPAANADYAAGMLSSLMARYGNLRQALSAYNTGQPNAIGTQTRWPDGERLAYADSVLKHYDAISAMTEPQSLLASAQAELPSLTASLSTLSSAAATAPTQPPTLPSLPSPDQTYHRQTTDYSALFADDDSQ
ncbi:MAG: transglycosylase SLT domain-containing protein [Candidatus Eremiobacteraeota bacterium]|nr:transglycosylase SLT domain-containing protein [Candidatus Eremiobacteraeota bacterium]